MMTEHQQTEPPSNEEQQALDILRTRANQQAVLAQLGLYALGGNDVAALLDEVVRLVTETLQVEYCEVLALFPDKEILVLKAGKGWQDGYIGQTVNAGKDSQAGFTLLADAPVIVSDLATEVRFRSPSLLVDHGVSSGISVVIQGKAHPYGVLGAHTTRHQHFTQDDAHFLQAIANILAEAIQRRQTEQALKASEEKLRLIFENAFDGISVHEEYLASGSRRLVDCNERYADMAGRSKQALLDIGNISTIQRGLDPPRSKEENRRLRQEKISYRGVFSWLRPDNKDNVIEYTAVPIHAGGTPLTIGIDRDITERVRTEEDLQRRTEEVELLFSIGQQLSQTLNTDIIYERLHTAISHIMDCDVLLLSSFDPKNQRIRCIFAAIEGEEHDVSDFPAITLNPNGHGTQSVAIQTGQAFMLRDYQTWTKGVKKTSTTDTGEIPAGREKTSDGANVTRSALIVPMKLEGQAVGVIQVMSYRLNAYTESDLRILESMASQIAIAANNALLYQQAQTEIAERERAEHRLKEYTNRLEEMVEERTVELRKAQEQLLRREKLAVLGQLAGGVGHELRNPLGAISNAVYYLKMTLSNADETTREMLAIINDEIRKSDKIVHDLLDFARAKNADRQSVTAANLVRRALAQCSVPGNIRVVMQLPTDIDEVLVDPQQIEQVLINLITNAYQAMPDGGTLTISARRVEDAVTIAVADTGCGIAPEHMETIFEPLFTTKAKGIGLGLVTSKNLVEANEGHIHVTSEAGKGSTFTIWLPVTPPSLPAAKPPGAPTTPNHY